MEDIARASTRNSGRKPVSSRLGASSTKFISGFGDSCYNSPEKPQLGPEPALRAALKSPAGKVRVGWGLPAFQSCWAYAVERNKTAPQARKRESIGPRRNA